MEPLENPQTAMINEIHNQAWILTFLAAKLEAQKNTAGSANRLRDFREPLIRLVTLASFNPSFAESIKGFYPGYQRKMQKCQFNSKVPQLTDETLSVWRKVRRALMDSKIITLQGE